MTDSMGAIRSVRLHLMRGAVVYATLSSFYPATAGAQAVQAGEGEEPATPPTAAPAERPTATEADAPTAEPSTAPTGGDASEDAPAATPQTDPQAPSAERADADAAPAPTEVSPSSTPTSTAPVAGRNPGAAPPGSTPAQPYPMLVEDRAPEPAPTGPVTQHFQLAFGLDTLFYKDRSYDVFSETDAAGRGSITLSYAFWLSEALSIAPELAYVGEGTTDDSLLGGALASTELDAHGATAGASIRYELWGFLAPHARLAGGLSWTRAKLAFVGDEDPNVSSSAWLPSATLGAGFSVMTPDRALQTRTGNLASLSLGFLFEGGYVLSSPLTVDLSDAELEGRLRTETSPLGELGRSAPYFRAALFGRL